MNNQTSLIEFDLKYDKLQHKTSKQKQEQKNKKVHKQIYKTQEQNYFNKDTLPGNRHINK